MKISIITAVYNRASTLQDAMTSVQRQSYRKIEHIIQDGGSTDGTLDVIEAHSGSRTLWISAPDAGIYDAINKGIERATGDVIGLLHSDDYLAHDDVISHIAAAFEDPDVNAVYGDLDYISARDPRNIIRHWHSGNFTSAKLKRGWMPPHPTLYLRADVFQKHGLYDTSFRIAADYDAILRWFGTAQIHPTYLPEVLVKMRVGGASNASIKHIMQKSREDLRALRRNGVGSYGTLIMKNMSKLTQFFPKGKAE